MYDRTEKKKWLYALADEQDEWDIAAKDILPGEDGSEFTIVYDHGQREFRAKTKLLGKHNIQNILGCVAVALEPVSYTHLDVYKRQPQDLWRLRR